MRRSADGSESPTSGPGRRPSDPGDHGARMFSAVGWSVLHSWGSSFFSLVVSIVLARLLVPEAFGLVALALVYIAFLNIFVEQGLASAVVQRADIEPEHFDTAFWMSVGTGAGFVIATVAAAQPVATLLGQAELAPIIRWLSPVLLFSGLQSTQRAILERDLAFEPLAKRTLAGNFAGGAAGIAAAVAGLGVWSLVVQLLITSVISTVLLWVVADWRPRRRFSGRHFRDLFGFSAHIFGSNLFTFANRHADDFLIGLVLGPVALGFYTVAYTMLRRMTMLLVNVITRVAFPVFSRVQHDPDRMRDGFYRATQLTALVTFPAFIGVLAVAPEFVLALYGDKWAASIPVLQLLTLIGIHDAAFAFNGSVILATGRASWRLWLSAGYAVAAVLAFAVAVRWGIVAVAGALVVSRFALSPVPILMLRRLLRVDLTDLGRQYVVPVTGSLVMWAAVQVVRYVVPDAVPVGVRLAASVLTGFVTYVVLVSAWRPQLVRRLVQLARNSPASRIPSAGPAAPGLLP